MVDWFSLTVWANLLTLVVLEIILGLDNLVFIALCVETLPVAQQPLARRLGLFLALLTRLALLKALVWLTQFNKPLWMMFGYPISLQSLVFLSGGLFLLIKGTQELHNAIEQAGQTNPLPRKGRFAWVMVQIAIFDILFSLDSVVTAVAISQHLWVMAMAIIIAVLLMILATKQITYLLQQHPTVKLLALSFLLLIGVVLLAEGFGIHFPRGYIYFAISFSIFVEWLNSRWRHKKGNKSR